MYRKAPQRIAQYLAYLKKRAFQELTPCALEVFATKETHRRPPQTSAWREITLPYAYGREWESYWFRTTLSIPPTVSREKKVYLLATPNADSLVFCNTHPIGALNPFHHELLLPRDAFEDGTCQIHIESYSGHRYPGVNPFDEERVILTLSTQIPDYPNTFRKAALVTRNEPFYQLFYDTSTLFALANKLDRSSLRRHTIIGGLYGALSLIEFFAPYQSQLTQVERARKRITPLLSTPVEATTPHVYLVGHAHIDHAWLWPIDETRRKVARTFANMAHLAEEYPEFVFLQSHPAQLEAVKTDYPEIFQKVVHAYKNGRWEPNGGMWVEADCNLPSGESLIRQFLIGKKTTRELLDYEGDTLWLPDVFGYAAALPQILKGCEISYFVTSKINWNDTTRFPHDTFLWRGIDGTGLYTHFITSREEGYNGRVRVEDTINAWEHLQHKDLHHRLIKPIGEGDGGGGTTRDDLETARRLCALEGAPTVSWKPITEALREIFCDFEGKTPLPEWRGELYLELHRGTYTTQARTKWFNRKLEFLLREAEVLYTIVGAFAQRSSWLYPHERLERCWKTLLTNQFHDIIPGSSIRRVYKEAGRAYEEVFHILQELLVEGVSLIAPEKLEAASYSVVNSFSWYRTAVLRVPLHDGSPEVVVAQRGESSSLLQRITDVGGETAWRGCVELPPLTVTTLSVQPIVPTSSSPSPFSIDERTITSPFYRLRFDSYGRIVSLFDLRADFEYASDSPMNAFLTAEDVPIAWDAWDIDADWKLHRRDETRLSSAKAVSVGPVCLQYRLRYAIGESSSLVQDIILYADSPRIDFETQVVWHESHRMLKVEFPNTITTNRVRCEVQYGHLFRDSHTNLPQDEARFEFVAHKWICVEEPRVGLALVNDAKYGHDADGSTIRLTLLRSPKAPDPQADMGVHRFTYALLPFFGGFTARSVVHEAYDLNMPAYIVGHQAIRSPRTPFPVSPVQLEVPFLSIDIPGVIVEALKPSEEGSWDDKRTITARIYEAEGAHTHGTLTCALPLVRVEQTNMMERQAQNLPLKEGSVNLSFRPFEIKTLLLTVRPA